MKNLDTFISEKFELSKKTQANIRDAKDLKDYDMSWKATSYFQGYTLTDCKKCFAKMEGYYNKKSKPLTLVHTIKDSLKLVQRFVCAIMLGWEEAIRVFKEEIISRNIMSETDIDAYFCKLYLIKGKMDAFKYARYGSMINIKDLQERLENYFDMYYIKYNSDDFVG